MCCVERRLCDEAPSNKKEDPDPMGDALMKTKDPLKDAVDMIEPLLRHAGDYEETHLLAFDVYRRKARLLLALRAASAAVACAPSSFAARRNVAHLAALVAALPAAPDTPPPVKTVLEEGVARLTGGKAAGAYAEALVKDAAVGGPMAAALAAEAVGLACGAAKGAAAAAAAAQSAAVDKGNVKECKAAVAVLARVEKAAGGRVGAATEALKARCAAVHPYCDAFGGAKVGSALKK